MPKQIRFRPIGVIRTQFKEVSGMPIQPKGAKRARGRVEILPAYVAGLQDLSGFSHVILLYHFHKAGRAKLLVIPFMETKIRGVFSTRAPCRPNAIGMSVVKLISVRGTSLVVEGVDMLDGTPLIDIKPYVPRLDAVRVTRAGWLRKVAGKVRRARADDRFARRA
jgi:tRNA-Thr(GGU) m(6)t(6)A37 methyltransferase TsaA